MRYTCVHTNCGCRAISLAKGLDSAILDQANAARVEKARRPVAVTAVGRYVDRKAPAVKRRLGKALAAAGKRISGAVSRAYEKHAKAQKAFLSNLDPWPDLTRCLPALDKAKKEVSLAEQIVEALNLDDLSGILVDELEGPMQAAFRRAAMSGLAQVGFEVTPDITKQMDALAVAYAEERGGELIKDLAGTTRDDLEALIGRAVEEGMSTDMLADAVQELGAFSESRAEMIARTELAYAHVQGNVQGWESTGEVAGTRWILGDLHDVPDVCDDCVERGVVPMGDDFADGVDYPPAHPNACFEGTSFASYGALHQMVRAKYKGPAITLVAARCSSGGAPRLAVLTIGPNHPVLTGRGFVAARDIKEGDQLVYDVRPDGSGFAGSETDLQQVVRFEDAFEAHLADSGATLVAGAAHYFHGDEAFLYGEVEAVRPTRQLLQVLDPGGVQHLGKQDLIRTDTDASFMSRAGALFFGLWRILAAAARRVSCGDSGKPLFGRHLTVSGLHCFRVVARHAHTFEGYAFDASTEHSIYNAGGFVVKNCICDVVPVLKDDEE